MAAAAATAEKCRFIGSDTQKALRWQEEKGEEKAKKIVLANYLAGREASLTRVRAHANLEMRQSNKRVSAKLLLFFSFLQIRFFVFLDF